MLVEKEIVEKRLKQLDNYAIIQKNKLLKKQ